MEFIKIEGYNYSINILGDVRNDKTNKILKKWIDTNGYYRINIFKKKFNIHRLIGIYFIPNPNNKLFIDHINNNKIDNSINNLRWVSSSENNSNSSKRKNASSLYKGVSFNNRDKKWIVQISINKKVIRLGAFNDEKEGAKKYNEYIIEKNLSEFYKLNDI